MKAKLILKKHNNCYSLNDYREPSKGYPLVIAHSDDENFRYKLSKQNCDEIFKAVDEDKKNLYYYKQVMNPYETGGQSYTAYEKGFTEGYNSAMEFNKDKVFTEDDLRKAILFGFNGAYGYLTGEKGTIEKQSDNYIQTLQQPTEIEIEIEMEWITAKTFCDTCNKVMYPDYRCEDKTCFNWQPKLDSEGCIILKKI